MNIQNILIYKKLQFQIACEKILNIAFEFSVLRCFRENFYNLIEILSKLLCFSCQLCSWSLVQQLQLQSETKVLMH